MATDAQSLLSQAQVACYECNGAPGTLQLMKLSLLAQILQALNPMADVTPQGLLNQANCYQCYGGGGMWQLMELALLSQIATNGAGGGGGPTCGNYAGGQPNFTPTSGCGNAIDTSNGRIWWYYSGQWN